MKEMFGALTLAVVIFSFLDVCPAEAAFVGNTGFLCPLRSTRLFSGDEKRSVSDYMGGHHAGKFDFDSRISGVTALNYEKSVVFDDTETTPALAPLPNTAEIPSWASRKVSLEATENVIRLGEQVLIQNEELTWEPFYAAIHIADGSSDCGDMTVKPTAGNLAPRGGRNNFSDSCRLRVEQSGGQTVTPTTEQYLVVRTETEHWAWRIDRQ